MTNIMLKIIIKKNGKNNNDENMIKYNDKKWWSNIMKENDKKIMVEIMIKNNEYKVRHLVARRGLSGPRFNKKQ